MIIQHDITIALTKGRILKETLPLLASVGIEPQEDLDTSRKLIVKSTVPRVSLVILRGSDVATYVRHGAADLGVAGKDMLLEAGGAGIYEALDLKIAPCRLMTAGPRDSRDTTPQLAGLEWQRNLSMWRVPTMPRKACTRISSSCTDPWSSHR